MARRKTHGTFTRDGMRRVAYSPSEAVELRFNGWTELEPAPKPAAGSGPATSVRKAAAAKDDSGKTTSTTPASK